MPDTHDKKGEVTPFGYLQGYCQSYGKKEYPRSTVSLEKESGKYMVVAWLKDRSQKVLRTNDLKEAKKFASNFGKIKN